MSALAFQPLYASALRARAASRWVGRFWLVVFAASLGVLGYALQAGQGLTRVAALAPSDASLLLRPTGSPNRSEVRSPQLATQQQDGRLTFEASSFSYGPNLTDAVEVEQPSVLWEATAGLTTSFFSQTARYNPLSEALDFVGQVELDRSDGLNLVARDVQLATQSGAAESGGRVEGSSPQGRLSANEGFRYDPDTQQLELRGEARLVLPLDLGL